MISLVEADLFFATHPLCKQYLSFDKSARFSAITTAERDICAALSCDVLTQETEQNAEAAICEQALFLLLNPEYLTGRSCVSARNNLSPRAEALLAPLIHEHETEAFRKCRFSRG